MLEGGGVRRTGEGKLPPPSKQQDEETSSAFLDFDRPIDDSAMDQLIEDSSSSQPSSELLLPGDDYENAKNKATALRMANACMPILRFAKKHPFYTAGFILGLGLLVLSAPLLVNTLSGKLGITVLHAQVAVGLVGTAMAFYYAVFLINLARRHAFKDELEVTVDKHRKFWAEKLKKTGVEAKRAFKAQVEAIQKKSIKELKDTQSHIEKLEKKIDRLESEKRDAQEMGKKLDAAIRARFPLQQDFEESWERTHLALENSNALLAELEPLPEAISEAKEAVTIEIADVLVIPSAPTEKMVQNQRLQKVLMQKVGGLVVSLGSFVKKNPGSSSLILTGIFITLAAGVGLYFWLHGMESVYLIGSLSLSTIIPLAMYGLSLVYEGYNSSTINELKATLEKIKADFKRLDHPQQDSEVEEAEKIFKAFLEDIESQSKEVRDLGQRHLTAKKSKKTLLQEQVHLLQEQNAQAVAALLESLGGEKIPLEEVKRQMEERTAGAQLGASEEKKD